MNLTPEDKLLLSVVMIYPTAQELKDIDELISQISNWDNFIPIVISHGSAPLFYKKLPLLSNNTLIPETVKIKLQQAYYKTLTRSMVLYDAFAKIASAFNDSGIKVIALKGLYLSECLYDDIALRQFSDLDVLVREEDGKHCLDILTWMGFKPFDPSVSKFIAEQTEIVHYTPMVKDDISVEIHIRLHAKNKEYAIKTSEFIENALQVTLNKTEVYALQFYALLIHLCVHLDKHFSGGNVQMKCFNDIVNLLAINKNTIDWQLFISNCQYHECEALVFRCLIMVHTFYQASLPENIIKNYAHLLTKEDCEKFVDYLHGVETKRYHVRTHWHNINEIDTIGHKVRYLVELIFPPKAFMIQKYNISAKRLVISDKQQEVSSKQQKVGSRHNYKLQTENGVFRHPAKWDYKLTFWWLWYAYRWAVGVKGVWKLIKNP